MKIIACDFDGTLCENKYPEIGAPKIEVINRLLEEKKTGSKIILWSCREGDTLLNAIKWCEQFGLSFDAVNDNLKEIPFSSRKIYATEYWDDRAVTIK